MEKLSTGWKRSATNNTASNHDHMVDLSVAHPWCAFVWVHSTPLHKIKPPLNFFRFFVNLLTLLPFSPIFNPDAKTKGTCFVLPPWQADFIFAKEI